MSKQDDQKKETKSDQSIGSVESSPAPESQSHWILEVINLIKESGSPRKVVVYGVVLLCIITILSAILVAWIKPNKITIGDSTLTFYSQDDVIKTVLPSNVVWLDTKIDVEPNSSVKISADGRTHLAIHYVVNAAQIDSVVRYPWSDPSGQGTGPQKLITVPGDPTRTGQKLCPSAEYGQLIAYVGPEKLDKHNPWPSGRIQVLGTEGVITNDTDTPQRVWLSVNDTILDGSDYSKQAYLLNEDACALSKRYGYDKCDVQALIDAKKNWKKIKDHRYWNIWFDDNVGSYIVKFEMKATATQSPEYCQVTRNDFTSKYKADDLPSKKKSVNEQYTTYDLNDLDKQALKLAAKHGSEEHVLILFDIDNTLLAMDGDLGSDQWYSWQKKLEETDKNKIQNLLNAQKLLFQLKKMRLTQKDVPEIIDSYNSRGFQTAALTARGKSMSLVTFKELRRNNINLKSELFDDGYKLEYTPLTTGAKRPVLYEDNVIMAAGQNKGKVFLEILNHSKENGIKAVLFVDDKGYNVDDFRSSLDSLVKKNDIDLVSFEYKGEEGVVNNFPNIDTMGEWCLIENTFQKIAVSGVISNFDSVNYNTRACE